MNKKKYKLQWFVIHTLMDQCTKTGYPWKVTQLHYETKSFKNFK